MGLVRPTAGVAQIDGRDVTTDAPALHRTIGLVPSGDRSFYLRISGLENLVFFARLHGLRRGAADRFQGAILKDPAEDGGGLGYLDVIHYASFTPNIGPYMEFKGNTKLPVSCDTSSLKCEDGLVRCPTGVGFGVEFDRAFIAGAEVLKI
jgi:ABC-type sugar transport system ATPase subunit